jgi:hypothetical protein
MKRKTAAEILSSDNANEIHDWLWAANLDEFTGVSPLCEA